MNASLVTFKRLKRWLLLVVTTCLTLGISVYGSSQILTHPIALAQPPPESAVIPTNATAYHFKLGDWHASVVSDGTLSFPASFFVPKAVPEEVEAALTEHFLPTDELFNHVNTLYVETDIHKVLIDTGAGNTFGPTVGHLVENLEAAGISPATIDTVILTHAHPDHIGGILDETGALRFPNANYYISEAEAAFWTAATVEMPNSFLDEETKATLIGVAQGRLAAIAERTTLFQMGDEVIPGIQSVAAIGHTPGQSAFLITSGEDTLLTTGDVFFSDPLNLEHPDWEVTFDTDPQQGVTTRHQLLETVNRDRRLLLVPHMPFPGLGHVRTQGDVYGWEPIIWQFNP
ncbi:MAG: MBL fold metallo-hydrolase [Cyanobacteria bacterium P01_F01_bin.86]